MAGFPSDFSVTGCDAIYYSHSFANTTGLTWYLGNPEVSSYPTSYPRTLPLHSTDMEASSMQLLSYFNLKVSEFRHLHLPTKKTTSCLKEFFLLPTENNSIRLSCWGDNEEFTKWEYSVKDTALLWCSCVTAIDFNENDTHLSLGRIKPIIY